MVECGTVPGCGRGVNDGASSGDHGVARETNPGFPRTVRRVATHTERVAERMTESDSDERLLDGALTGDRQAFSRLLDRYLSPLRRFLFRLGAAEPELDDLTQEVFVVVIRGLKTFRRDARFSTWLFGVAVNAFRSARRKTATAERAAPTERDDAAISAVEDPSPSPDASAEAAEHGSRLFALLARLPLQLREAFVLRHVEGMEPALAAEVIGVPEGTLRRRVFEARERLRQWLDVAEAAR